MERHTRDFKGVWISKEIWLSRSLSLMEKVLFVEIHSLDNERGCYASNRYFANFFDVSERQIRRYLTSLRDNGFITVKVANQNQRIIRAAGKYRRISESELIALNTARDQLVDNFNVGSKKPGRKLPGRVDVNVQGARTQTST